MQDNKELTLNNIKKSTADEVIKRMEEKEKSSELTLDDIKKMTSKEINNNWDAVKKVLENIKE